MIFLLPAALARRKPSSKSWPQQDLPNVTMLNQQEKRRKGTDLQPGWYRDYPWHWRASFLTPDAAIRSKQKKSEDWSYKDVFRFLSRPLLSSSPPFCHRRFCMLWKVWGPLTCWVSPSQGLIGFERPRSYGVVGAVAVSLCLVSRCQVLKLSPVPGYPLLPRLRGNILICYPVRESGKPSNLFDPDPLPHAIQDLSPILGSLELNARKLKAFKYQSDLSSIQGGSRGVSTSSYSSFEIYLVLSYYMYFIRGLVV